MTTKEERLDELLSMARSLGYLESRATAAEHAADMAPKGSTARPRRDARELRKLAELKAGVLAKTRARFLADFGGAS